MLEDFNMCAICGATTYGFAGGVPVYFCAACWQQHEADVHAGAAWTRYLLGVEKARRKRRNRLLRAGKLHLLVSLYENTQWLRWSKY